MPYAMPEGHHSAYVPVPGEIVVDTRPGTPKPGGKVLHVDVTNGTALLVPPDGSPSGSGSCWEVSIHHIAPAS